MVYATDHEFKHATPHNLPRTTRAARMPHPTGGKPDLEITRNVKSSMAYGSKWRSPAPRKPAKKSPIAAWWSSGCDRRA